MQQIVLTHPETGKTVTLEVAADGALEITCSTDAKDAVFMRANPNEEARNWHKLHTQAIPA